MGGYPNIKVSFNSSDSEQQSARAIIAIFPYVNSRVTLTNYKLLSDVTPAAADSTILRSNVPVIITSDILSLNISTGKQGLSHTLSSILAPHTYNYLATCGPSDYIMAWIVNSDTDYNRVIDNLKNNKPANDFNSGLKFFGQIQTIQENYRVAPNGVKIIRYNLNAVGFQAYHSQVVFSPFMTTADENDKGRIHFATDFLKKIGADYLNLVKSKFSVQEQFIFFHKVLLGTGPGQSSVEQSKSSVYNKTVKDSFNIPTEVAKALGQEDKSTTEAGANSRFTYADVIALIIGIQQYDGKGTFAGGASKLGPDVVAGGNGPAEGNSIFVNSNSSYNIKGRRLVNLSPNMNGTIIGILQEHSNSVVNEIYGTLRPRPVGDAIVPTLVCRQIPFSKKKNDTLKTTQFLDLPRFTIDQRMVMSYDISKSDALRLNTVLVTAQSVISSSNSFAQQTFNVLYGGWSADVGDIRRNGQKSYQVVVSDDAFTTSQEAGAKNEVGSRQSSLLQGYNDLLVDWLENAHLMYSGNITTFGIQEPICVGENVQFGELVGHIENVNHSYSVDGSGKTNFSTSIDFSHGMHIKGTLLDAFDDFEKFQKLDDGQTFGDIRGGSIKETIDGNKPPSMFPKDES